MIWTLALGAALAASALPPAVSAGEGVRLAQLFPMRTNTTAAPPAHASEPTHDAPTAPVQEAEPWRTVSNQDMARQASETLARFLFWMVMALIAVGGGLFLLKLLYNLIIQPFRQRAEVKRYFAARRSPLEELAERAEKLAAHEETLAEAAELFSRAGALQRAAACTERLGQTAHAAELWERAGDTHRAAELYLQVGDPTSAAEVHRVAGEYLAAAANFERAGEREQAATMFELADRKADAARIHEELGNLHRAARIYEEAGELGQASELLARLADQGVVDSTEDAEHLASLMERAGRRDRAAEYYALAGDLVRAIEILVANGDVERAAELYSGCSENLAPEILARISYDAPVAPRFAQMFLKARDHAAAGLAFENLGRYQEAAELYSRCGDHYQAGEMWLILGDREQAAAAFERAGDQTRAAELYEMLGQTERAAASFEAIGDHYRAGTLLHSLGQNDRALILLQRVDESHEGYLEASTLVAEMMLERGFQEGAALRLRAIAEQYGCTADTLRAIYTLGLAEIRLGRVPEAVSALTQVVNHDLQYADAAQLLSALRAGGEQTATALLPEVPTATTERHGTQVLLGVSAAATTDAPTASGGTLVEIRDDFHVLSDLPLFQEFSLGELRQIWAILKTQQYAAGAKILEDDQPGTGLYVLRAGEIEMRRRGPDGAEKVHTIGEGQHFGEVALIANQPIAAQVVAQTDVELFFLPQAPLRELMDQQDAIALKLYRAFTQTLAERISGPAPA